MKKWFRKLLGIDILKTEIDTLNRKLLSNHDRIDTLYNLTDIGVDINQNSPSWAVVCLRGKQEIVRFYGADENTIQEIRKFLRHFNRDQSIIDAPLSMKNLL